MEFIYSTGGRENYFKATNVGDCVTRAVCNATGKDYLEVYNTLKELSKEERKRRSTVRDGVSKRTTKKYIESVLGWKWHSCCQIGSSKRIHLKEEELTLGTLIVKCSKHLTCVKDRVLYDTYDCTRKGNRMVYGYWTEK